MSGDRRDDSVTDDTGEHESFLARWSQRKAQAREGIDLPDAPDDPARKAGDEAAVADVEPVDAAAGESADATEGPPELPPIDSLDEDSDYSPFLAAGVSPDLQRDALRKLFHSPKFNVRDGLDDYDLDFTNPEPLGNIVTAEMRHRIQAELERLARLDEDRDAPGETVAAVEGEEADEQPEAGESLADAEDSDEQPRAS